MRMRVWLMMGAVLAVTGCEQKPANTGPVVHCFNERTGQMEEASPARVTYTQDVSTGKVQVTCPTGQ